MRPVYLPPHSRSRPGVARSLLIQIERITRAISERARVRATLSGQTTTVRGPVRWLLREPHLGRGRVNFVTKKFRPTDRKASGRKVKQCAGGNSAAVLMKVETSNVRARV